MKKLIIDYIPVTGKKFLADCFGYFWEFEGSISPANGGSVDISFTHFEYGFSSIVLNPAVRDRYQVGENMNLLFSFDIVNLVLKINVGREKA